MKVSTIKEGGSGKRAAFSLATNEVFGTGDKRKTKVEYHSIVAWGRHAELCDKYMAKGKQVAVIGKLRTRSWVDGDEVRRRITEIHIDELIFLGKREDIKDGEVEKEENPF